MTEQPTKLVILDILRHSGAIVHGAVADEGSEGGSGAAMCEEVACGTDECDGFVGICAKGSEAEFDWSGVEMVVQGDEVAGFVLTGCVWGTGGEDEEEGEFLGEMGEVG